MKKILSVLSISLLFAINAFSQNAEASLNSDVPRMSSKVEAPSISAVGKEVVIAFKNTCERPVVVFAGPKENIRAPRITTYGGLSLNQKLYLHENEVVCLMSVDKRPTACTVIKPGITTVIVNSSANGISAK